MEAIQGLCSIFVVGYSWFNLLTVTPIVLWKEEIPCVITNSYPLAASIPNLFCNPKMAEWCLNEFPFFPYVGKLVDECEWLMWVKSFYVNRMAIIWCLSCIASCFYGYLSLFCSSCEALSPDNSLLVIICCRDLALHWSFSHVKCVISMV